MKKITELLRAVVRRIDNSAIIRVQRVLCPAAYIELTPDMPKEYCNIDWRTSCAGCYKCFLPEIVLKYLAMVHDEKKGEKK